MKNSCKKLLQSVYDRDQNFGKPYLVIYDEDNTLEENAILLEDVQRLISDGYVTGESSCVAGGSLLTITEKGERFVENGFQFPNETSSVTHTIFNIENATNSVIGTQSNVTLNINNAIKEAREQINSSNSNDKAELHEIISLLEDVVNNKVPIKKGLLSKFTASIQRNAWITSPITSIVLDLLMH